jgi:hypothetical protein
MVWNWLGSTQALVMFQFSQWTYITDFWISYGKECLFHLLIISLHMVSVDVLTGVALIFPG